MTVLQLTSHLDVGGITQYVLSLSRRLVERGHRVIVASDRGHREADVRDLGATHWPVPLHTSAEFSLPVWRAWRHLAARLQREPVDVIHAHTRVSQVIAQRLARRFRIPYVTTWHGAFRRRLGRQLWPCTGDVTITISRSVHQHLLQDFHVPAARARCISNGIDVAHYATAPDPAVIRAYRELWRIPLGRPVIGGMGRMASGRVKGFDLVLLAAQALETRVPDVEVLMVGDGPRRPFLEEIAKRLGLQERVHFVGASDDVRIPLAAMDVFVFSSRWPEGFGLSLVEAMAAGKPVVATRVGATQDIVEHGQSGWLVDPEDPLALAEGIARLLNDAAAASRLGSLAQMRVRELFSLDRMVDQIEAVYREVVESIPTPLARGSGLRAQGSCPQPPAPSPGQSR